MSAVLSAIQAHRVAYAALSDAIDADPQKGSGPLSIEAGKAERATLDAVFAAPVASLSDVSAKAAYLADEIHQVDDYFGEEPATLRAFLQSLRLSLAQLAPLPDPDPLLEVITRYRSQLEAFNKITDKTDDEANAMRDATWGAFEDGVADGTITLPSPTTLAGAVAALRCAFDEDTTEAVSAKLRDVALAYLEGGSV